MTLINNVLIKLKLVPKPVELGETEVLDAWSKIESVLATSYTATHVDVAENMFDLMLHRFKMNTKEERSAPVVSAMQVRINQARERVMHNTIH